MFLLTSSFLSKAPPNIVNALDDAPYLIMFTYFDALSDEHIVTVHPDQLTGKK